MAWLLYMHVYFCVTFFWLGIVFIISFQLWQLISHGSLFISTQFIFSSHSHLFCLKGIHNFLKYLYSLSHVLSYDFKSISVWVLLWILQELLIFYMPQGCKFFAVRLKEQKKKTLVFFVSSILRILHLNFTQIQSTLCVTYPMTLAWKLKDGFKAFDNYYFV